MLITLKLQHLCVIYTDMNKRTTKTISLTNNTI